MKRKAETPQEPVKKKVAKEKKDSKSEKLKKKVADRVSRPEDYLVISRYSNSKKS